MAVQYLVKWPCLYHMTRISTDRRSVSSQKAPSTRKRVNKFFYNFNTALYQVLEIGTSDRTNIGSDQLVECLYFSLCPFLLYLNNRYLNSSLMVSQLKFKLYHHYNNLSATTIISF